MTPPTVTTLVVGLVLASAMAHAQVPPRLQVRDAPARPAAGTAAISGVVTSGEESPQPVRSSRVTLNSVDGAVARTETTDDNGRFVFANLPAGRFNLSAGKPGLLTANYGARRVDRPGTPLALADGQTMSNLTLRLSKGGVVTGTVRDGSGRPVPGIRVQVLKLGYSPTTGGRQLGIESMGAFTATDDRGVYRGWGLGPGDYVVMALPNVSPGRGQGLEDIRRLTAGEAQRVLTSAGAGVAGSRSGAAPEGRATIGTPVTYAPVFYPAVTDVAMATSITVALGEERDGIDVVLDFVPTARIRGSVRLPTTIRADEVSVTLNSAFVEGPVLAQSVQRPVPPAYLSRDGTFAIAGVGPGRYSVLATTMSGARVGTTWWAQADVTVDGHDIEVSMEMQPPMKINGRIVFEGTTEPPKNLRETQFVLTPAGNGARLSGGPQGGQVNAQGQFQFPAVTPGLYFPLFLTNGVELGPSWATKSSRVNGRDAIDAPVQVKPGEDLEWVVTFTDRPTKIAGTLQDASGRAATEYFVVAFSTDKVRWTPRSSRVRSTRPATDGSFSIADLPPGEYFVAALTDLGPGETNDPALLESLVAASVRITLREGQTTTQDLRLAGTVAR